MSPKSNDTVAAVVSPPSVEGASDSTIPLAGQTTPDADAVRFAPPSTAGDLGRLGKYRIQKELGRGGMGAVFLAFDERLERQVALKVMLPKAAANATAKDRFLREARAAARVSSDHVVTIHEADEIDGVPYIALQFLHGSPLDKHLKRGGTPATAEVVRIARETALGLAAAHALGLVHRDIKPGNVWLEAPTGRVKVLDFGLAKPVEAGDAAELTASGAVVGTPAYMAPEQGLGRKVDHRADLFSLGCMTYRLATGKLPFERATLMAVLAAVATEEPTPVRELNPAVPAPLADLIRRLMAKDPADRPQTAQAVADELARMGEVPAAATAARERRRVSPAVLVGGGLVALAVAAVAAVVVIKFTTPPGDRPPITEPNPPPPPKPWDPETDRAAAVRVLADGGTVWWEWNGVSNGAQVVGDLPKEPFRLFGVTFDDNSRLTDDTTATLAGQPHLREVALGSPRQTGVALRYLRTCPALTRLDLTGSGVTDDDLAVLSEFRSLESLILNGRRVGDAGMAHLKGCETLRSLSLTGTKVGDAGMAHLAGCADLRQLFLQGTTVTDDGMVAVAKCAKVWVLDLQGTAVGDAGVAHLKGCEALRDLDLRGTKVSAGGFEELRKWLPNCRTVTAHGTHEPK